MDAHWILERDVSVMSVLKKMRQKTDRRAVLRKMILSTNYKQMEMEEYLR